MHTTALWLENSRTILLLKFDTYERAQKRFSSRLHILYGKLVKFLSIIVSNEKPTRKKRRYFSADIPEEKCPTRIVPHVLFSPLSTVVTDHKVAH
jgi:hypothetical protein